MKNILKKIGLIGIIIGVLSPFITLPSVNAANGCNYYLHQYLFLDYMNGFELLKDYRGDGHTNYATFLYTFPDLSNTDLKINIINADPVTLNSKSDFDNFYSNYILLVDDNENEDINSDDIKKFGNWLSYDEDNINVSSIIHGYWGSENSIDAKRAYWKKVLTGTGALNDPAKFYAATIQKKLKDKTHDVEELFAEEFGGASLSNLSGSGIFSQASLTYAKDLEKFINKIIVEVEDGSETNTSFKKNYVLKNNKGQYFFNVNINRTLVEDEADNLVYGYRDNNGKYYVVTAVDNNYNGRNSYDGAIKIIEKYNNNVAADSTNTTTTVETLCVESEGCYIEELTTSTDIAKIDIYLFDTYYWPAVYNVEYQVCNTNSIPDDSSNTHKKWTLTYDLNVTDEEIVNVTNKPDPIKVTGLTDTSVKLYDKKPERKDFEFKEWCTEKDGKGTCVEAGKVFENKDMIDKTLHAYWVKPGAGDPEKQGVVSYVLGFAGIGVLTYGLYYVINKKNLFKQI